MSTIIVFTLWSVWRACEVLCTVVVQSIRHMYGVLERNVLQFPNSRSRQWNLGMLFHLHVGILLYISLTWWPQTDWSTIKQRAFIPSVRKRSQRPNRLELLIAWFEKACANKCTINRAKKSYYCLYPGLLLPSYLARWFLLGLITLFMTETKRIYI
jgi:hypothetical protein